MKELETKLCRHNKKRDSINGLHKGLRKGGVNKRFYRYRNLRREFILSITFKAIDSSERLSFKIHSRYFTFACYLTSMPLYTIFEDLAFQSLCLVPNNIDFGLSCVYCV